jgi:hypothetical protein
VSAALLVAREASSELLLRGFLLTALSGWLADRLYEADAGGLEGLVALPGGLVGSVPDVALWSASLLATALFAPAAFLTAEETAEGVGGAMLLRTAAGRAMAAAAAAAGGSKGRGAGSTSSSSSSGSTQQQAGSSEGLASQPLSASAAIEAGEEAEEPLDPEILEYRVVKVTEVCVGSAATQLAYRITLARSLWRLVLGNAVYVVTRQNLAASFVGNVLLSLLQYVCARGVPDVQQPVRSK